MSRILFSLRIEDLSAFARSLRGQLAGQGGTPSHLELLNMLVRCAGWRNFQHFRADAGNGPASGQPGAPNVRGRSMPGSPGTNEDAAPFAPALLNAHAGTGTSTAAGADSRGTRGHSPQKKAHGLDALPDEKTLRRLRRYFDAEGRLLRWPSKHSQVEPCMWAIWSKLPAGEVLGEASINSLLRDANLFDDHALLRRALIDYGMVSRTPDGRQYWRMERKPSAMALALIQLLKG